MQRTIAWLYILVAYAFIFLPVAVLVLFSFQDGALPVPPFRGVSLQWYADVLSDRRLMTGLRHSLIVAIGSSAVASCSASSPRSRWPGITCRERR